MRHLIALRRLYRYAVAVLLLATPAQAVGADVTFETSTLTINSGANQFDFQVEVATTPEQRRRGLMFRDSLEEDHGMLFDFERTGPVTMWMRNTYISLDMLFIDGDGRIHRIVTDTQPLSDAVIGSDGPVRAVLELRAGVSEQLGIETGDYVVHPIFGAR